MAVTPYLQLFLPERTSRIGDTVDGVASAMSALDTWAQAHAAGGGFNDGQVLYWEVHDPAFPSGSAQQPPTNQFILYDADGVTALQTLAGGDVTATGVILGDDFIVNQSGAMTLWFRTPGLYVCNYAAAAIGSLAVQVVEGGGVSGVQRTDAAQSIAGGNFSPQGCLVFPVAAVDQVVETDLSVLNTGATLSPTCWQSEGSTQDVWMDMWICRVA